LAVIHEAIQLSFLQPAKKHIQPILTGGAILSSVATFEFGDYLTGELATGPGTVLLSTTTEAVVTELLINPSHFPRLYPPVIGSPHWHPHWRDENGPRVSTCDPPSRSSGQSVIVKLPAVCSEAQGENPRAA
jgi:hypothetical protein